QRAYPGGARARRERVELVAERRFEGGQQPVTPRIPRDADALERERVPADLPAVADATEHRAVVDEHIVEEHLVHVVPSDGAENWPNGDARRIPWPEKEGEALVLLLTRPHARREHTPLRHARVRRPDLLAVEVPAAGHLAGSRGQRREVGAGVGL